MGYLVIAASLNPESRSRLLAKSAFDSLKELDAEVEWLDLSEHALPLCDGDSVYKQKAVKEVAERIRRAEGILLSVPIYNFSVNAAAKNLVELAGNAWSNKVVGFLCAAGGKASYMSVMGLAGNLMLDFRCLIVPRFVYATGDAFEGEIVADPKIRERIIEVTGELHRICTALKK